MSEINGSYEFERLLDVQIPMEDGVNLSCDIYLPDKNKKYPTVLMRTPYSKNIDLMITRAIDLVNNGYACVIQDSRGRWDSDGEYYPFIHEGLDGYITQEWIGNQSWSNGEIAMAGSSYGGSVQWASAPYNSKYLKAMAPKVICCDFYKGLLYPGGAFQLHVALTWGMRNNTRTAQNVSYYNWEDLFMNLPLVKMDELAGRNLKFWKDWIGHPNYDEYWEKMNVENQWSEITVPALNMGGWYDLYSRDTFTNFNGLIKNAKTPEAKKSKLIVGPWPHPLSLSTITGDVDFGPDSMIDLDQLELRWFNYWLKGIDDGILDEPPIKIFIMGVNKWREENEWPLKRTEFQNWNLHSNGNANSIFGDGIISVDLPNQEPIDVFEYDPDNPVETIGGTTCCSPNIVPWGAYDQRPVESREDVLCYTTEELTNDLEVTGPIKLVLYASSNAINTDWTGKLVDVFESGYAMNLCDGIVRASHRDSFTNPEPIVPGQVYKYEIDLGVTANVFKKGHRIRLEISSSNFPKFDRNPNTGNKFGFDSELKIATQKIFHDSNYQSHIILPIIK